MADTGLIEWQTNPTGLNEWKTNPTGPGERQTNQSGLYEFEFERANGFEVDHSERMNDSGGMYVWPYPTSLELAGIAI